MSLNRADAARIVIMDLEGGDKIITDSGGLTKYGVSQRSYPDLDIRDLKYIDAEHIFYKDYWDLVKGDQLPSPLNIYVADAAFNMGPGTAMKLLQRAAGGLSVDGRWGPRTQAAVLRHKPEYIARLFNQERLRSYPGIKNFDIYGAGWFNRVLKLIDIVHAKENECSQQSQD